MSYSTEEELAKLGIGKKINALRERKNISLENLARQVSLTPVLMSQIEQDVVPPTVATLLNIARVLDVGIDHFFQTETMDDVELTRANEALKVSHSNDPDSGRLQYDYRKLSYRLKGKSMEPFLVEFDPDVEEELIPLTHDGEEFCYCLEGEIEFISNDKSIRLQRGDSLYYFSKTPHVLRGHGPGKPKALFVLLPGKD